VLTERHQIQQCWAWLW